MNPSSPAFEATITGIPLWLLREYLTELSGVVEESGSVRGTGWKATLAQVEDYQIASLRVGRVRLEIRGDAETIDRLRPALDKKLLRAGG